MPSAWARLRAASASSSGVIATLPLGSKVVYWDGGSNLTEPCRRRSWRRTRAAARGKLSPPRQENLLRSVRQPDPPRAEEIDAENEVGVSEADVRNDQRWIADDLSSDFHV